MSSDSKTSASSGGIGFCGLLTIVFIILKLNPGGYLTTAVADWPWIGWGLSVFCPVIFCFYIVLCVLAVFLFIFLIGVLINLIQEIYNKNERRRREQQHAVATARKSDTATLR